MVPVFSPIFMTNCIHFMTPISLGWEVFVVNEDSSCWGSKDALRLLIDTDGSEDCEKTEDFVMIGGPEGMPTYQIVGKFFWMDVMDWFSMVMLVLLYIDLA